MKHGLLLINLGTPEAPSATAVRRYLREFLADKRVISLPAWLRYTLLYAFILPFRTKKSAHAYHSIWTKQGSPLLYHSQQLLKSLQHRLEGRCTVALGMRYGQPSLLEALKQLQSCDHITLLPLYPQYSSAATGSSLEKALQQLATQTTIPSIRVIRDFHAHPSFIEVLAAQIKPYLATHDFILFSYHGIPVSHLKQAGCQQPCTACTSISAANQGCYRAQCIHTTALVATRLELQPSQYSWSFQSRLGKTPWIQPYTDEVLTTLQEKGVRRLAVVCPSFVTDCLETLEEIGIQLKAQWRAQGGDQLSLISCLNNQENWQAALLDIAGFTD